MAQDVFADVENPTADELKALPQGKKTNTHRSCLHDDISVVIVVFGSEKAMPERCASMRPPFDSDMSSGLLPGCLPAYLSLC